MGLHLFGAFVTPCTWNLSYVHPEAKGEEVYTCACVYPAVCVQKT